MAIATPPGGYDYQFVNAPHNLVVCVVCYLPSRDPHLTECCGHIICKSCVDQIKASRYNACPMCKDEVFKTVSNKQIDREVKSLHVYCTNKEKGCEWQGELNYINNHLGNSDGCQFEEVKCSNECGKMIERRYLTSHVETECPRHKVNCQYCHDRGEHEFIEGQHKEECPKLPLACPNKCEVGTVPREDMEAHRKKCPLEMIQCEYHNVGCEVRMARKDQVKHKKEKMEDHLMMMQLRLAKTESKLESTEKRVSKLESIEKRVSRLEVMVEQRFEKRVNRLEVMMQQMAISGERQEELLVSTRWFLHLFSVAASGDQVCPVIIKMTQFSKQQQGNAIWYSKPFYTHKKGYKMCIRVDAAGIGNGKGTHLSVFLYLMKGPHDDELRWPLRGEFEVKLLNQISDSEHHRHSWSYDNAPNRSAGRVTDGGRAEGWGHDKFIFNEDLHKNDTKCQFIKDDCIFFQLSKQ